MNGVGEHSSNTKIGLKKIRTPNNDKKEKWYLSEVGRIYGPMSYDELAELTNRAMVSRFAYVMREGNTQWIPIGYYFRIKTPHDLELDAIKLSVYDAMFFVGGALFIAGVVVFMAQSILAFPLLLSSVFIELVAIYLERIFRGKALLRTIGNAIALFWILIQIILTMFFLILVF